MLRIAISVEGATEREFVQQVLVPHFMMAGKYLQAVDIRGNVSLDKIKAELPGLLYGFNYVTTLYDFYGFKRRENRSIEELEQAIHALVPASKQSCFIPYVQQYEFEALLFSAPSLLAEHLGVADHAVHFQRLTQACGGAERINDGFDTCPSRRIVAVFSAYNKKLHGPDICQRIGLPQIREACPRFHCWLQTLENLPDTVAGETP